MSTITYTVLALGPMMLSLVSILAAVVWTRATAVSDDGYTHEYWESLPSWDDALSDIDLVDIDADWSVIHAEAKAAHGPTWPLHGALVVSISRVARLAPRRPHYELRAVA